MSHPGSSTNDTSTSSPYIRVRYRGTCGDCGVAVQTTPRRHVNANDPALWVRCQGCGQITLCDKSGTELTASTDT